MWYIRTYKWMPVVLISACSIPVASAQAQDGKALVEKVCTACHSLEVVTGQKMTKDQWSDTVADMVSRGASASDEDLDKIVDYLAKNYGRAPSKININDATARQIESLGFEGKDAEAIVKYRDQNGKFKDVADLKRVPGLDEKRVDAVKDRLTY
jgi:competence protein ComEA